MNRTPILMVAAFALASGQKLDTRPEFDAASVKLSSPGGGIMRMFGGPETRDPERWTVTNMELFSAVVMAYNLKEYQVIAPEWQRGVHIDIIAKVPKGASRDQFKLMLRKLLKDRFHMTSHVEDREFPVYELVVSKDGLKLNKWVEGATGEVPAVAESSSNGTTTDKDGYPIIVGGSGFRVINGLARWQVKKQSMDLIARFLSKEVGRPVLDGTGLAGFYGLTLSYAVDNRKAPSPALDDPSTLPAPSGGPSIFKAVQDQLGLSLEPKKGRVDVLVVDHLDKVPTEN